ncbi:hypothetical protein HK099_005946 [Clydaea vesicula]|uniref:Disintegrin and metalloproteinase domain-containing protein B n=1 Tax=Clydaea vesicula TaxID=447962 RepID=A0AAD5TYU2_9FUNG|nr:hypothetical protein HK099_005946 [Clydaea vesicula]
MIKFLVSTFSFFLLINASPGTAPVRYYDFLLTNNIQLQFNSINLKFSAFNESFTLILEKNSDLLLPDSIVHLHDSLTNQKTISSIVAHPYKGVVVNSMNHEVGWARIMFHEVPLSESPNKLLFDGTFTNLNGMYHINTVANYRASRRPGLDIDLVSPFERNPLHKNSRLILFKDSHNEDDHKHDSLSNPMSATYGCGFEHSEANTRAILEARGNTFKLKKRQQAGVMSSCFGQTKRVLKMSVAADCSYTQSFRNPKTVLNQIISYWNEASQVYEVQFNIKLAVIEVKILQTCGDHNGEVLSWNKGCTDNYGINDRLSDFSQWRGQLAPDEAGLWHLLTACNTGPSVGVAWLSQLCVQGLSEQNQNGKKQFVSGTGVSSIVPVTWKVVAHEIGHNFGAIHDCTFVNCPATCDTSGLSTECPCCACAGCDCGGQFLMHPTDNSAKPQFSPCSLNYMCSNINEPVHSACLLDAATVNTIKENTCGNGVVEAGEQCDCGKGCATDSCCNNDCTFKAPAVCDDLNDECCRGCQIIPAGEICRPSFDMCTKEQFCNGKSATCEASIKLADGTSCNKQAASNTTKGTTCASGVCTSRELQCISLVGDSGPRTVGPCKNHENDCKLLCETENGICLSLSGDFIDGTPCVGGGFCRRNVCEGASLIGVGLYYFTSQPALAYPITIAILIVFLLFLYCFAKVVCCRGSKKKNRKIVNPKNKNKKNNNNNNESNVAQKYYPGSSTVNPSVSGSGNTLQQSSLSPLYNSSVIPPALAYNSQSNVGAKIPGTSNISESQQQSQTTGYHIEPIKFQYDSRKESNFTQQNNYIPSSQSQRHDYNYGYENTNGRSFNNNYGYNDGYNSYDNYSYNNDFNLQNDNNILYYQNESNEFKYQNDNNGFDAKESFNSNRENESRNKYGRWRPPPG